MGVRDEEVQTMIVDRDPDVGTLIPKDEAEATRCLERGHGISAVQLAGLSNEDILPVWRSFFRLHPEFHPDDADVWPVEVSAVLPLATVRSPTVNTTPTKPSVIESGRRG